MGLSAMAEGMFPRGAGDLVLHFTEDCNVRLADYLVSGTRVDKDSDQDSATSPVWVLVPGYFVAYAGDKF